MIIVRAHIGCTPRPTSLSLMQPAPVTNRLGGCRGLASDLYAIHADPDIARSHEDGARVYMDDSAGNSIRRLI